MTTTPHSDIAHIQPSQAQKEATANEAFDALDRLMNGFLDVDASQGSQTFTSLLWGVLRITGADAANQTITIPARQKRFVVIADHSGGFTMTITAGGTGISVVGGDRVVCVCDGTDIIEIAR